MFQEMMVASGGGGSNNKGQTQGQNDKVIINVGHQPTTIVLTFPDADDITSVICGQIGSQTFEIWSSVMRSGHTVIRSLTPTSNGFEFYPNSSQLYNKEFVYATN